MIEQAQQQQQQSCTILWQWQCDIDPWKASDPSKHTWQNYSDRECLIIEEAFKNFKENVDLQDYHIDFKKMLQISKKFKNRTRRIRRQAASRFLTEMPEPKILIREQKTMNQAFGTIQHFLDYIMKRTPEAYTLYQRLKTLTLESISYEFEDVTLQVTGCIMKGAEAREKTVWLKTGTRDATFISQAQRIVDFIPKNWATLGDFLKAILQVYTMETFICYWLNELLRSENWEEINVLTPYLVCLVYTFQLPEYTIQHKKSQNFLGGLFSTKKQKLSLYRGTVLTKDHLALYDMKNVKYFSWNGVTSTSKNKNIALSFVQLSLSKTTESKVGVLFKIKTKFASAKDSEGMIDISKDSQNPTEQEIILAPGTVFQLKQIQLIRKDLYVIKLKVTKKFDDDNQNSIPLLGILHDGAVKNDTALIEGFPSQVTFKLLELLKGNKLIRKIEIKNSLIEEHLFEEIENMRATTNVKKQDIKLMNNTLIVSNVSPIPYYFSEENLSQICEENHIEFSGKAPLKNFPGVKIALKEKILEKFHRQNQWEELWDTMGPIHTLDISLKQLPISDDECSHVVDCIRDLRSLQNLKLTLSKDQTKNVEFLWAIKPLNSLEKLELNLAPNTEGFSLRKLKNALYANTSLKYISLHLNDSANITDGELDHFKCCLQSLVSLEHLSCEFGWCQVSDTGLGHLVESLALHTTLKHLSLQLKSSTIACKGLDSLKNRFFSLPYLQHLSLDFSSGKLITDKCLENLKDGLIGLTALQYLSLDFGWCEKISDDGLEHLKNGLKSLILLKKLSLSFEGCEMITDKGCLHLKHALLPLKSLESLSLKFDLCKMISNGGLNELKNGLESLQYLHSLSLSFSTCDKISNEGLNYLRKALVSFRYLKDLSLKFDFCKEISGGGLNYLKSGLRSILLLENLSLSLLGCDEISETAKVSLKLELGSIQSLQNITINF